MFTDAELAARKQFRPTDPVSILLMQSLGAASVRSTASGSVDPLAPSSHVLLLVREDGAAVAAPSSHPLVSLPVCIIIHTEAATSPSSLASAMQQV